MKPIAIADRIVLTPFPRVNKSGSIYLPECRSQGGKTSGEVIEARVVSVGPQVREEIKPGVILLLDPNALDGCRFTHDGTEYVSVQDKPYDWVTSHGAFFGVTKHD